MPELPLKSSLSPRPSKIHNRLENIHVLCNHKRGRGSENGNFWLFSVLKVIAMGRGAGGQKTPKLDYIIHGWFPTQLAAAKAYGSIKFDDI